MPLISPQARIDSVRYDDGHPGPQRSLFLLLPLPNLSPITVACIPPSPCSFPQQASTAVWMLVVWLEGRRDHTQGRGRGRECQ